MGRVWVLGSLNVDLVVWVDQFPRPGQTVLAADGQRFPGGKGANQAVAAAAAGAEVRMIGRVGADFVGGQYLTGLAKRGVDVSGVCVEPDCDTGQAVVLIDGHGENCIVVIPAANGMVGRADLDRFGPSAGDVVLLQMEVPVEVVAAAVAAARAAGAMVLLNPSPYQQLPTGLIEACDVVVVNEDEARQLRATGIAPTSLVITRGAAGATWGTESAQSVASRVVHTTGAGDAFAGTLAAALADGRDRPTALALAVAAGARAVGQIGAQGWTF